MKKKNRVLAWLLVLLLNVASGWYVYQKVFRVEPLVPPPMPVEESALPPPAPPAPQVEAEAAPKGPIARLTEVERNVRSRRAGTEDWLDARPNTDLHENDSLRTLLNSSAVVSFGDNDEILVDSNTLLVIKPPYEGTEKEITVSAVPGPLVDELDKKPAAQRSRALQDEISKRQIRVQPVKKAGAASAPSRAVLRSLPDQTTQIQALGGEVQIIGPKGDTVTLKDATVTRLGSSGALASPRLPLGVPELASPGDGRTVVFQSRIPKVDLKWKEVPRAWRYRVVLAADSSFDTILADEMVNGTSFTIMNLSAGTYYWRVVAHESDGFMGDYSAVRSLKAVFDDTPPKLSILAPPEMFVSPVSGVELRGKTESGARVKVNGQEVPVSQDGSFAYNVVLKEGVNLITVEANDAVGNRAYGKRLLTYKGSKRSGSRATSSQP